MLGADVLLHAEILNWIFKICVSSVQVHGGSY